jgi:hypothetical protein
MTVPTEKYPSMASRVLRRILGASMLALLFFVVLWMTVFNAMSAAIVSAALGGGALVASSSSDVFGGILEAILEAIGGALAAIASVFSFDG